MKKLVIIGCGGIGTYHIEHFLEYKDIELAGFCDIIPERAKAFVKRAGKGKAFTDFMTMYDEIKPDMAFICVPPYAHGQIEFETIKRGIPFFVEKPLALDIELAKKIAAKVQQAGLITASGFQCRYSNIVENTKKFVHDNEIVFMSCARIGGVPGVEWWRDRERSGGQIVEQTIHQYDMIRYVLGEPIEVFTYGARGFVTNWDNYNTEDVSTTVVKFASGAVGTISTGCYATDGAAFDSKITFSAKNARIDHYIIDKAVIYGGKIDETDEGLIFKGDGTMLSGGEGKTIKDDGTAGVVCDRTFVDAVLTGDASKIRSSYADALKSVAFTLACNKSMDSGMPVKL